MENENIIATQGVDVKKETLEIQKLIKDNTSEAKTNAIKKVLTVYVDSAIFTKEIKTVFDYSQDIKLARLQVTDEKWIKSRKIGSKKVGNNWVDENADYIPIRKVERLLNFLFNFNWKTKLVDKQYSENKQMVKGKEVDIFEAYVILECTATLFGQEITRTVSGSWKMFSNPAVSRFAVIQAAISQAKKNFAKEFGIGADLNDDDMVIEDRIHNFVENKDMLDSIAQEIENG